MAGPTRKSSPLHAQLLERCHAFQLNMIQPLLPAVVPCTHHVHAHVHVMHMYMCQSLYFSMKLEWKSLRSCATIWMSSSDGRMVVRKW